MDALVLMDLMGHRSIRTTLRYAEVNPERTQKPSLGAFGRCWTIR